MDLGNFHFFTRTQIYRLQVYLRSAKITPNRRSQSSGIDLTTCRRSKSSSVDTSLPYFLLGLTPCSAWNLTTQLARSKHCLPQACLRDVSSSPKQGFSRRMHLIIYITSVRPHWHKLACSRQTRIPHGQFHEVREIIPRRVRLSFGARDTLKGAR